MAFLKKINEKKSIIGFVRYSQKIKFSNEKKERNVFEAGYFEYRFNIFKNITLKSFQEQTNMNFILLLLHSENMPYEYKNRFAELEKTNSFLYNLFMEDTKESFNEVLKNTIEYVSFEEEVAVTFRIDNDDAVPNDFIQKLSGFLKNSFFDYSISIPNICIIKHISDISYMVEERYYPSNSIGLAYITNKDNYKTIMDIGPHQHIREKTSMILIDGCIGLQTINGENAANAINYENVKIYKNEHMEKYLKEKNFTNIDLKYIRILSILSGISLRRILKLITPPLLLLIAKKIIRKNNGSKKNGT